MSVYKRPLAEGEILEDNRFASLNTTTPHATAVEEVEPQEDATPKGKGKKEKEAPVEAPVEIVVATADDAEAPVEVTE